jgi:hypothetical protein
MTSQKFECCRSVGNCQVPLVGDAPRALQD